MNPETNSHILISILAGVMIIGVGMLIFVTNLFHNRMLDWMLLLGWTVVVVYATLEKEIYKLWG
jgi:asparagine N-glycosylation enzyme membrane subunit Stt3